MERHKVYKYALQEGCLDDMIQKAGSGVCNANAGGYIGGVAEYERLKRVGAVNKRVAILSASYGSHQIMGFNHELIGYDTPEAMFEAFHQSEAAQLNAFVAFVIATDLAKYLHEAEKLADAGKSSLTPLNEFAKGYNGKSHDNYHIAISAAYQAEKKKRQGYTVKPTIQSTTVQGGITATVSTIGAGGLVVKDILDGIKATREVAETVTTDLQAEVDVLKNKISEPNYILWAVIVCLIVAQTGIVTTLWARVRDRLTGLNL